MSLYLPPKTETIIVEKNKNSRISFIFQVREIVWLQWWKRIRKIEVYVQNSTEPYEIIFESRIPSPKVRAKDFEKGIKLGSLESQKQIQ